VDIRPFGNRNIYVCNVRTIKHIAINLMFSFHFSAEDKSCLGQVDYFQNN